MGVGTSVVIADKDGARVVELDTNNNLPVSISPYVNGTVITSGDNVGSAQTGKVIWTPQSGKKIHLFGYILSTDTAGSIKFNMGATTIIQPHYLPINSSVVIGSIREVWVAPSGDAKLEYTSTVAGNHSVTCFGEEI